MQLYQLTGNTQYLQFAEIGLRMGALLPAAAQRHVRRPHQSHGRRRTDAVELQPGLHDRRRHAALPGHRQLGLPLPGATDRAARRWRTSRRNGWDRKSRSSRRSTFATCCTWTRSPTTRPAQDRPGLRQLRVGKPAPERQRVRGRLAASAQLLLQAAIVQIYALLSSPPQHVLLFSGWRLRARAGVRTGGVGSVLCTEAGNLTTAEGLETLKAELDDARGRRAAARSPSASRPRANGAI